MFSMLYAVSLPKEVMTLNLGEDMYTQHPFTSNCIIVIVTRKISNILYMALCMFIWCIWAEGLSTQSINYETI